jgi:hypothetical protein
MSMKEIRNPVEGRPWAVFVYRVMQEDGNEEEEFN